MSENQQLFLSLSCVPLPTFIEGGYVSFKPGDRHPDRRTLDYFVLIIMKKGRMFLAEDDLEFEVKENEMFVLQPRHHHYSYRPCAEETEYFWLHFACAGHWSQSRQPEKQIPLIKIPTLHYYTNNYTIFLYKHHKVKMMEQLDNTIEKIFLATAEDESFAFWKTQQLFIDVLQYIQVPVYMETACNKIAAQVERYLRDHYDQKITNIKLAKHFHFHPNYICRCMKESRDVTPMQFLTQLRIEEAKKQLRNTNVSVTQIASQCGFKDVYYFSNLFRKYAGCSPLQYRQQNSVAE